MTNCSKNAHIRSHDLAKIVIEHYADLVNHHYLSVNQRLQLLSLAVDNLINQPNLSHLNEAKKAWLSVRKSYAQTEAFRFYGGPIDEREARINAWPIDESYIDYVVGSQNSGIVNASDKLTQQYLTKLNENLGESNISLGYHAIEFLLWGQDLYQDSAGKRPYQDYSSNSNANRRALYLRLVTDILINDTQVLAAQWTKNRNNYRKEFIESPQNIQHIIAGLGLFIRAELAGERLQVALDTVDQEDEQSCFSDSTHDDIYFNIVGIKNVLLGRYTDSSGSSIKGNSIAELLRNTDDKNTTRLLSSLDEALLLAQNITPPFDQSISFDYPERRQHIQQLIDALIDVSSALSLLKRSLDV